MTFTVKDLREALKGVPGDAVVMVRIEHDSSYNPGEDGYEPASRGSVFYSEADNSFNVT